MRINLDELEIVVPKSPTRGCVIKGVELEDYVIKALYHSIPCSTITVSRIVHGPLSQDPAGSKDRCFFDMSTFPPVPVPYVSWQATQVDFRGNGICGLLISHSNETLRSIFSMPLYSDTYFEMDEAKQVWRKLAAAGIAVYCPTGGQDRWHML